jgi:Origin of replication binding protein
MAMKSFRYIRTPTFEHDPRDCLETVYDLGQLTKLFTVRHEKRVVLDGHVTKRHRFEVYPTAVAFMNHLQKLPLPDRTYHELILDQPQKIKVDIDAPSTICPDRATFEQGVAAIRAAMETAFMILWRRPDFDVMRCESKEDVDTVGTKFSVHLIIAGVYVSGCLQAQEFMNHVKRYLPAEWHGFVDWGVNKRLQCFRIVGCHKGDCKRIKQYEGDGLETLITQVDGCEQLEDLKVIAKVADNDTQLTQQDIDNVLMLVRGCGLLHDHDFIRVRDKLFMFRRTRSGHCDMCERMHDADNTLVVTASVRAGKVTVFRSCRHKPAGMPSRVIGTFPCRTAEIADAIMAPNNVEGGAVVEQPPLSYVNQAIFNACAQDHVRMKTEFDTHANRVIYDEPQLRPFALHKTVCIQAGMKMGKTKKLKEFLAKHFTDGLQQNNIRFISFRQTFSSNVKENFPDFQTYSEIKGPITTAYARVIVQVESLHRLEIGVEPPDLVILDECEAIWEQFESGLLKSQGDAFAKFAYMLKYAKCCIFMDAYLSTRTWHLIQSMRGTDDLHFHRNMHQNAHADTYKLTGDRTKFLSMLHASVQSGERIAIMTNSMGEGKALQASILRWDANCKIKFYSSETLNSEKREHFGDVNEYWSKYDVLIYTPTITAGVSFERKHFDRVFCTFMDQSCPVETCVQMIGRIRDVKTKQYVIMLSCTGASLPTDTKQIQDRFYDQREVLMANVDGTGLRIEYGAYGEIIHHTTPYFQVWTQNTRMRNMSRNAFAARMVSVLREAGASVQYLTDEMFEAECPIAHGEMIHLVEEFDEGKQTIRQITCEEIANSPDLNDDDVELINETMQMQQDVPMQTVRAMEKYRLRACYNYQLPMTPDWVKRYRTTHMRKVYRNLLRICVHRDPMVALERLQSIDREVYIENMQSEQDQARHQDVVKQYTYNKHRLVIGLMRLLGFQHLNDTNYVASVVMCARVKDHGNLLWDTLPKVCQELGMKYKYVPKVDNPALQTKLIMEQVNKITKQTYNITFKYLGNGHDMWQLTHGAGFKLHAHEEGWRIALE